MVATRFARLRRARDRHAMVATRFARLRRARDRHAMVATPLRPAAPRSRSPLPGIDGGVVALGVAGVDLAGTADLAVAFVVHLPPVRDPAGQPPERNQPG